jgi:hypothetical protein
MDVFLKLLDREISEVPIVTIPPKNSGTVGSIPEASQLARCDSREEVKLNRVNIVSRARKREVSPKNRKQQLENESTEENNRFSKSTEMATESRLLEQYRVRRKRRAGIG